MPVEPNNSPGDTRPEDTTSSRPSFLSNIANEIQQVIQKLSALNLPDATEILSVLEELHEQARNGQLLRLSPASRQKLKRLESKSFDALLMRSLHGEGFLQGLSVALQILDGFILLASPTGRSKLLLITNNEDLIFCQTSFLKYVLWELDNWKDALMPSGIDLQTLKDNLIKLSLNNSDTNALQNTMQASLALAHFYRRAVSESRIKKVELSEPKSPVVASPAIPQGSSVAYLERDLETRIITFQREGREPIRLAPRLKPKASHWAEILWRLAENKVFGEDQKRDVRTFRGLESEGKFYEDQVALRRCLGGEADEWLPVPTKTGCIYLKKPVQIGKPEKRL